MEMSLEHNNQDSVPQAPLHDSQNSIAYPSHTIVHAKLEMTEPSDHDEQEADAVASTIVSGGKIARKISGGGDSSGIAVSKQMESQLSQLQGGGRQMPDGLRNMMESGFGRDFSQVRLHTDSEAASMSSSIHAKAFTHGNDIYFNQGQFSPETSEGQRLVAHELTHVAQGGNSVKRSPSDTDVSGSQDNGFEGPFLQKSNRTLYSNYSVYTPGIVFNAPMPQPQQPSQNDYANCYIFNLDGVLLSKNSTNSLENEVVVDDGVGNIITTGLNMEQFLYITAVVQHEAASKNYTYEEMFAVATSIVHATKEKEKKSEFVLVEGGFTSVKKEKKEQHIDAYNKNGNTFLDGLRQSNQDGKFPVARKATLSVFALKTAPSNGLLDKGSLLKKYEAASRWDGTDFYTNLKKGVIIKIKKVGEETVKEVVEEPHPKFKENSVIIIPKNILDSYYKANGNNGEPHIFRKYKYEVKNDIYYIKGNHDKDALIAVGNAGKSIFWRKKRGVIKKKDWEAIASEK